MNTIHYIILYSFIIQYNNYQMQRYRILWVDDEIELLKPYVLFLEEKGFDIITFTNVFAHIKNLKLLINALKIIISDHTVLIIENHYLASVIKTGQFDTFYQEHPRTYSVKSFVHISESLGLNIQTIEFPNRYGGNIRVYLNNLIDRKLQYNELNKYIVDENKIIESSANWNDKINVWKKETKYKLNELYHKGIRIAGKAFPARASIIINLLDIDENIIPVIFEQSGSKKIGHYVPGTKIIIKGDDDINNYDVVVNFAWHINEEIIAYLKTTDFEKDIYTILPSFKKL